jgi:outer membrane protein OmpA-like peptidoglycan-associated protein
MNSRTLAVAIAFAVWGVICRQWYVCNIKDACGVNTAAAAVDDNGGIEDAPEIRPDTSVRYIPPADQQQPLGSANNTAAKTDNPEKTKPAPPPTTKTPPTSTGDVSMEELEDRMVIRFPYSSIRKEDNAAINDYLDRLAAALQNSGGTVTITGHTDFVGDSKDNHTFGLKRAQSIRDILVKKGVPKNRIKVKSFGDTKPVDTNDTPAGRYKNRRVEIRVGK